MENIISMCNSDIPKFVEKLYLILENPIYQSIVSWDTLGTSFSIKDMNDFTQLVIPQNFKHKNMSSFIRQLNKYSFYKIKSLEEENQSWRFKNEFFQKGRIDLLCGIKRRKIKQNRASLLPRQDICKNSSLHYLEQLQAKLKQTKASQKELEIVVESMCGKSQKILSELRRFGHNINEKDRRLKQCLDQFTTIACYPTPDDNSLMYVLNKLKQQRNHSTNGKESVTVRWSVPPRVLLVDDDYVHRGICGKMLSIINCFVDYAKDGAEALRKPVENKYDLILIDVLVPKMTTENIREFDKEIPIVSMTSNLTQKSIMEYIGIGVNDILLKPFSKKTLYNVLLKHCAHLKLSNSSDRMIITLPNKT
ncbi:unnamed protein product [Rhizopus stolonifer]